MAGKIGRDDLEVTLELPGHRLPGRARLGEAVHEHDPSAAALARGVQHKGHRR